MSLEHSPARQQGGGKESAFSDADALMPRRKVAARYDVSVRTIVRWEADPAVQFPRPVVINRRKYYYISALIPWERARAASSTVAA
jgi:hypothetical protein